MAKTSGVRVLGYGENGEFRHFTNNIRPIRSPADMKGIKMRTMEHAGHMAIVKSLGAIPTSVSWTELYTSLKTKVAGGQENSIPVINFGKLYEVQDYMILLFIGCFMDAGASIILFTPILAPILHCVGFHPLHAGIVMVLAVAIGLITPPVGVCLFAASAITGLKLEPIIKEMVPFIISVVVLLVITFVPEIVLMVPRLFGFA